MIELIDLPANGADGCAAVCVQALDRMLLATNLSDRSRAAEDAALALASHCGAMDMITATEPGTPDDDARAARLGQSLSRLAPTACLLQPEGSARDTIIQCADGYSMVIPGKSGRNWVAGKFLGATAAHVAEGAGGRC